MSNFMMNVVSWILLLLVILTLYLIDKVNHLSELQDQPEPEQPMQDMKAGDILFAGLEGKRLWDGMTGREIMGFDSKLIDALRIHYAQILHDHIIATFEDGVDQARMQKDMSMPVADRQIKTPRGQVTSWLPAQHLGSIYKTGFELGEMPYDAFEEEDVDRLKKTIDSVTSILHQRTSVPLGRPYAEFMIEKVKTTSPSMPVPMSINVQEEQVHSSSVQEEMVSQSEHVHADETTEMQPNEEQVIQPQSLVFDTNNVLGASSAQAYEDQQRQDIAAENEVKAMDAVMIEPQPQANPI
jgi:hypothetical protein